MTEITGKRSEPAAAHKTARIAHGILTTNACPVRERRPSNNDRPEQFGPNACQHHHRPSRLTIPNDTGFAFRVGMQIDDLFDKDRLGTRHIFNRLAWHWLRQKPYEIAWVPRPECDTDFAVGL